MHGPLTVPPQISILRGVYLIASPPSVAPPRRSPLAQVGCGPFMQTYALRSRRPDLRMTSLTAIDPGIKGYLAGNTTTTYRSGTLLGTDIPIELLPVCTEALPTCYEGTASARVPIFDAAFLTP